MHQVFRLSIDAKAVEGEDSIHGVLDYIHHNPISGKWNLVTDYIDYEYFSARVLRIRGARKDKNISLP